MKKILVTGSNGMLGSNIVKQFTSDTVTGFDSKQLDVTNREQVSRIIEENEPDIIIHTAAYTDVEASESDPDKAYLVNAIGTQNLVNMCINNNILFVYISSTGIYGNAKNTPFDEFDEINPMTVHHRSKYAAEKIIQNHLNRYLILRTGWLFGGELSHGKNFVYKRYLEAKDSAVMYSDNSQIGNPTYIKNLVNQIETLLDNKQYGVFNCIDDAEDVSRYDYVSKIVENFGLGCEVKIAPKGMFKRSAPVSNNESAINYKLNLLGLNVMRSWDDSLAEYVRYIQSKI